MDDENIQSLIEIYEKIKNLKAVKCKITHEKIQIDDETGLPISKFIGEKVYERIGFCPEQIRKERISCSHTNAPDILHNALDLLDDGGDEKIINLRNNLMDTVFQIHQLDHQKSDAEKKLSVLTEKNINQPNEISQADINVAIKKIREIESEHSKRVDKIAEVRNQIMLELDKVIKDG